MFFKDRKEAGRRLAKELLKYKGVKDVIVLAIPRGGLEVGHEIASELHAPMDVLFSKKISHPTDPELALGAVTYGGETSYNESTLNEFGVTKAYIEQEKKRLLEDMEKKYEHYKPGEKFPSLKNKLVILTDDGVATGHTTFAAIKFIKKKKPRLLIVALPVAPLETVEALKTMADKVICLHTPEFFIAVGGFYRDFPQLSDEEAKSLLRLHKS